MYICYGYDDLDMGKIPNLKIGNVDETHTDLYKRCHITGAGSGWYTGRFWKAKKIITFWDYPTEKHLSRILLDIEEKTGIKPSE